MRISCDPSDQGYLSNTAGFMITLNGKPIPYAITADEELGVVHVVRDETGVTVTEFGAVKIERVH